MQVAGELLVRYASGLPKIILANPASKQGRTSHSFKKRTRLLQLHLELKRSIKKKKTKKQQQPLLLQLLLLQRGYHHISCLLLLLKTSKNAPRGLLLLLFSLFLSLPRHRKVPCVLLGFKQQKTSKKHGTFGCPGAFEKKKKNAIPITAFKKKQKCHCFSPVRFSASEQ